MSSWVSRLYGALAFLCISFGVAHAQNTFLRNDGTFAQVQAGDVNGAATFPNPTRAGDIIYWNGSIWTNLPGNNTGTKILQETSAGVPSWSSLASPTYTTLTTGTSLTYTPPGGVVRIRVRMCGGGGGGGASVTNAGSPGTDTSFGSWTAIHGGGGSTGAAGGTGGSGGVNGTGTQIVRLSGANGNSGGFTATVASAGGAGGSSPFGGAGAGSATNANGNAASANTCSGGQGGGNAASSLAFGAGGGAAEYVEFIVSSPGATTYTVGGLGNGGTAGTHAGGNGAAGLILIEEFYY